jgi:DNA-binding MarR family transcriptional regulator
VSDRREFDRDAGPIVERLRTGLAQIALALRIDGNRGAGDLGLSALQLQLLAALARAEGGGARLSELAFACGVRRATASEAVGALVEKGLVSRRRSAVDARALELRLTPGGRRTSRAGTVRLGFLDRALARLAPGEQEALLRSLTALVAELAASGRLPVARTCPGCRYFRPNAHPGRARPHHCAFADVAFADDALRLDCPDFEALVS